MHYTREIAEFGGHKWLIGQFRSMADLLERVESSAICATGGMSNVGPGKEGDGWADTVDLKDAIRLARFGWPKGRGQMIGAVEAANVSKHALTRKTEALDVGGAYPIVPLACAGDPICMRSIGEDAYRSKPVVRLVVNVAVTGAVSSDTIMRRGGAILSWVDELEATGMRCEVDVIETGLFKKGTPGQRGVLFTVSAKLAHEPLDIDRLAFALAHPGMQRRIFFATYEREDWALSKLGLTAEEVITYGAPTDVFNSEWLGGHSVYFPAMLRNNPDYVSPAMAVAAVERMLTKGLQLEAVREDQAEAAL